MNNDFSKNYAAFIFDWTGFSEKNLIEMNQEHEPDIYGFILLKYDGQLYIADIQWETIAAYDRRAGGSVILRKLSRQQIINDFSIEQKRKLLRYSVRKQKTK